MKNKYIFYLLLLILVTSSCNNTQKRTNQSSSSDSIEAQKNAESVPDTASTPQYGVYCNTQYSYCISYPSAILFPQGESDSGDGQIFLSEDGVNELRVYRDSRPVVMDMFDIEKAYTEDINAQATGREITYKLLRDNYYVISGISEGRIFYQKTIYRELELITAILSYSKIDEQQFEPLIEPIFDSLK